nr:serine/threonine protein kinase [Micromonospora sp. DSM 115978]
MYGVQARLSAGDTGPVYLARRDDGTRVLVKVLAPELARERGFLDRLEAELTRLRRAAPFGVADVVEIATRSNPPHVVVEYVDGPTLD